MLGIKRRPLADEGDGTGALGAAPLHRAQADTEAARQLGCGGLRAAPAVQTAGQVVVVVAGKHLPVHAHSVTLGSCNACTFMVQSMTVYCQVYNRTVALTLNKARCFG